ncbi:MAG: DUF6527 family protein [Candidatus Magasanikbacteria bacterium]|jgi:hypothetical protein
MASLRKTIASKLKFWLKKKKSYNEVLFFKSIDDPGTPKKDQIFVIGEKNYSKRLILACPDSCGEIIMLNLMPEYSPSWKIRISKNKKISVYPSIDNTNCGSHFWLKDNRVIWAKYIIEK